MKPTVEDSYQVVFDRGQAFLIYATFTGDIERTAVALNVSPVAVLRVADEENWAEKLKPILELKKSNKPGDMERAINRALNFVQAHKFRMFLERIILRITDMPADEFEKYLLSDAYVNSRGNVVDSKFNTRALADLASAMEKCHAMTYSALNDTAPERARRKTDTDSQNAADFHVKLADAMQKAAASNTPRVKLLEAQILVGDKLREQGREVAETPTNPLDNDEH